MDFKGIINFHPQEKTLGKVYFSRSIGVILKGDRNTILESLGAFEGESPEEKVVSAYLKEGSGLFSRLGNNFSLCIYDTLNRKVFLIRDRFGVYPLYFRIESGKLSFSSNISYLRGNDSLRLFKIKHYLNPSHSHTVSDFRTFFEQIHSVPPASYVCVFFSGEHFVKPYWKPSPFAVGTLSESQLFEAFRDKLFTSVKHNTQSFKNVGAHLSGGMDSSIISIIYAKFIQKEFHTFYLDSTGLQHEDVKYARLVSKKINSIHHELLPEGDIYDSYFRICKNLNYPSILVTAPTMRYSIVQSAKKMGCDAILTGDDGDSVVGHGYSFLDGFREKGDWGQFLHQVSLLWEGREPSSTYYPRIVGREGLRLLKQKDFKRVKDLLLVSKKEFGYSSHRFVSYVAKSVVKKLTSNIPTDNNYFIKKEFSESTDTPIDPYYPDDLFKHSDSEILQNFVDVVNEDFPKLFEENTLIGMEFGLTYLYPFFDKELFELCLAIPDRLRFGNGYTRWLLRESMRDLYPDELLKRRSKDDFFLFAIDSCKNLWLENKYRFLDNAELWHYVDKKRFLHHMQLFVKDSVDLSYKKSVVSRLNRVLVLGIWLDTLRS